MAEDLNALPLPELYDRLSASGLVSRLLGIARDEDLGPEGLDLTGALLPPAGSDSRATVHARTPGVVAGLAALPDLLDAFESQLEVELHTADGLPVASGEPVLTLLGPLDEIVTLERTLLNLLSRLSGIASRVRRFVQAVAGRAELLDTRKTTPGLRVLEKYAVRCGGGHLHRLGLHDAVLIKDNHLAAVAPADLTAFLAGAAARARGMGAVFVEVEVDTLGQLAAVLDVPAGLIDFSLLDNMTPALLRQAVALRDRSGSSVRLEASGGITLETIDAVAATGVERISAGSLTHQATSLDLGLDIGLTRGHGA
jgi:nicotinate-nucleotide pyrophosphorylase (carboxylating)